VDLTLTAEAAARGAVVGTGAGLLAVAVVLTFRSTGVLNFALGGIASVSAFTVWDLWTERHAPLAAAVVVALAVSVAIGLVSERVMRLLASAPVAVRAIATLGLLLLIDGTIVFLWGPADRFLPALSSGAVAVGAVRVGSQEIGLAVTAIVAAAALGLWTRTRPLGMASLAIGEDADAARLLGVRPARVTAVVWGLSALLAGLAGIGLSGGQGVLNSTGMTLALVASLAAVLLGGFERLGITVAAAAGVGALTAAVAVVPAAGRVSGLVESTGFLVVLAVVLLRPRRATLGRA
jgi:branched-subunit amino acid ABC-type transport system permease component